ncbi:MAG: hypothetical protein JWR32_5238 [Mycobacterium sp.]|nr:hypothetical protein [Mycobacterium sp.]
MNLSIILDAETVGNVLAQADAALKASLEPGELPVHNRRY